MPGSTHLAFNEIDLPYLRPPRRRPLILLGATADQACTAAEMLRSCGYTALPVDAPLSRWPGPWACGEELAPAWEPSPLVGRWVGRLPTGRVVDLACGSGRDAVYLAMHGAQVTGIDILADALAQATALARRHRVSVRFVRADLETDDASWMGPWSTILVQRFLHRGTFPLFSRRLAQGGYLLYETFHIHHARTGRRPRDRQHLLFDGEILAAAAGLSIDYSHQRQNEDGDWTASLVAKKRATVERE